MKYFLVSVLFLLSVLSLQAQVISGFVVDSASNEILEFVNVQDLNTLSGTITNSEGYFEIKSTIPAKLRFSFLGYYSQTVEINSEDEAKNLKVILVDQSLLFQEVVLEAERSSLGKQIIQRVIKNKKERNTNQKYACDVYQQTTMTKLIPASKKDSIPKDSIAIVYLNEIASSHFVDDNKFKKVVRAEIKTTGEKQLKRFAPMTNSNDFRGSNRFVQYNPIEYFVTPDDFNFDIYDNQLNNQSLSDRPITSPIANTALANYTYRLKKMDFIGSDTLFTIAVRPRFKGAPLWRGFVYVNSKDYQISKCELDFTPGLNGFRNFSMTLLYSDVEGQVIPTEKRLYYEATVGKVVYEVKSTYRTSEYNFNPDFDRTFFSSEQVRYEEGALKPDAALMTQFRGVALEKDLRVFFNEQDSIYRSITSDEYLEEQDSIFNSITWRKLAIEGIGYRKRAKGITLTFNSVLQSFQAFGVDGYRINPGGTIRKEFINSNELDIFYNLSYGVQNNNLKGQGSVGYTFYPQKFARFYVGGGDIFDLITVFQSLDAIIARSNFISHQFVNTGYSMELVNGLYFNSKVEFSDKQSVRSLNTNEISKWLFGDQETALDFERYRVFSVEADLIYRFGQKYMTRGRKKIVLPDNNPVLKLSYRKGIPGVFDSEVNFDYLELNLKQQLPATKLGSLNWELKAGSFVNKANLRQLEYNFFRGSTKWIFTNPLRDLQQIGATQSTASTFYQGSLIHHFDGFFLDKVPLINKLQMELLAGGGTLIIPDNSLYHAEVYLGLGKKLRIWGETMQIACYAVTSDNSLSKATIQYKFGLNFYNAFSREWLY